MRARAESRVIPIVTENCMQGVNGHRPGCPLRQSTVHAQVSLPRSCSGALPRSCTSNPPPFVHRCPFPVHAQVSLPRSCTGVPSPFMLRCPFPVHAQVSLPRSCTGVPSPFMHRCPFPVHAQVSLPRSCTGVPSHSCASNPPPFVLSLSKHERWSAHMPRYANATLPPFGDLCETPSPLTGEGRDGGEEWLDDEQPRTTHAPLDSGPVSSTGQAFRRNDGVIPRSPSGIQGGLRTRQPLFGTKSLAVRFQIQPA